MNALSPIRFGSTQDPPHLHLASGALSFLVLDDSITYSQATGALMRAAIRDRLLRDVSAAYLTGLEERLERTLNRTMMAVEAEAAAAIRKIVRLCLDRGMDDLIINAAAEMENNQHGRALPDSCVSFIVIEETSRNG